MVPYPNSGEPEWRDLKGQLWRVESHGWIDIGIRNCAFRLFGAPDPGTGVRHLVAYLTEQGRFYVLPGYILDGSSVPLLGRWLDNRTSGWPATVHDAAHEAMRARRLSGEQRTQFAALYRDMLKAFGAWSVTAWLCYAGLRLFGAASADPDSGEEYAIRGGQ